MPTTQKEIREWAERGLRRGAEFMLVVCDTFDYEVYPVYLKPGESPLEKSENLGDMQRLMECYHLGSNLTFQFAQARAHSYEPLPLPLEPEYRNMRPPSLRGPEPKPKPKPTPERARVLLSQLPGLDARGLLDMNRELIAWSDSEEVRLAGDDGPLLRSLVSIDLAEPESRDRVARWMAKRLGLTLGSTAPNWYWWDEDLGVGEEPHWVLQPVFESADFSARDVPALADLDPNDDTRLPDGSRWVDAVALAIVAVHVGATR